MYAINTLGFCVGLSQNAYDNMYNILGQHHQKRLPMENKL